MRDGLAFWVNAAEGTAGRVPRDADAAVNTVGVVETTAIELDAAETTALLQETPRAYRTQINDVLLTALALTLSRWTGSSTVCIDLEGHGREALFDDIDLTRTVGWFTSMFPVRLEVPDDDLGSALKAVKEQLRRIPDRGVTYGLLRYLHEDAEVRASLSALPQPDVAFSYLHESGLAGRGIGGGQAGARTAGPARERPRAPIASDRHQCQRRRRQVPGGVVLQCRDSPGRNHRPGRRRLPRHTATADRALPLGARNQFHAVGLLQGARQPAGTRQAVEAARRGAGRASS